MKEKYCPACELTKNIDKFYFNKYDNKPSSYCKKCTSNRNSTASSKEKQQNKASYDSSYRLKNKDKIAESKKKWYQENQDTVKIARQRNKTNKNRISNESTKKRRKVDPGYALTLNLRSSVHAMLKGKVKAGSAVRDLGCSIEFLKSYLEELFYPHPESGEQMTWENKGLFGWHVDHRIPLVNFDLTNREDFLKACHYTNLQPLWAKDNLKKGAKIS